MNNEISINKIIADIKATKGNRSGCQGLHSSLESDGYLTSICKWARATSPKRIDALVELIEKQEAALISWEKTMMEVCGEDAPASVANEIRALRGQRDTVLTALRAQVQQLAAENVGMDAFVNEMLTITWQGCDVDGWTIQDLALKHGLIRQEVYCADEHETLVEDPGNFEDGDDVYFRVGTPATDAYLAGINAEALPANIAEIIDSGDLETICYESERSYAEDFRLAFYNFRQLREGAK